jgi:hypothetical protein
MIGMHVQVPGSRLVVAPLLHAVVAMGVVRGAYAQQQSADTAGDASGDPLQEVVVTAERRTEFLGNPRQYGINIARSF